MRLIRSLVIVPCSVSSKEQKYTLSYRVESRNGIMIKSINGFKPFTADTIEDARKHVSLPKIIDLRIAAIRS